MYIIQPTLIDFKQFVKLDKSNRLVQVLEALDAEELIAKLERERKGRRDNYPIRVLWQTLIAGFIYKKETITDLIEELKINPTLCFLCGVSSEKDIPKEWTYSRFLVKLVKNVKHLEKIFDNLLKELNKMLPNLGRDIALDSTDINAFSNGYKGKKSDKDACWGVKDKRERKKGKTKDNYQKLFYWFGYKLHLLVDACYEIPLKFEVTPANVSDSTQAIPLLESLFEKKPHFKEVNQYFIADAGYDSKEIYQRVAKDYCSKPIIPLNLRGEKEPPFICNHQGTPLCASGEKMYFQGFDKGYLKYRAPCIINQELECKLPLKCSDSSYGMVVKLPISKDYRRFTAVPRETKKWRRIYKKRTAIERVFARLKRHLLLNKIYVRGLDKVKVHTLFSLLIMLAGAKAQARNRNFKNLRAIVNLAA